MPLNPSSIANNSTPVPLFSGLGLIVICGATATGKSGLAIALAQRLQASRLNSAILSADSRQVYREFNIGTAKPSVIEQSLVPHYLIDICEPTETLTVADYQAQAQSLIERGWQRVSGNAQCLDVSLLDRTASCSGSGSWLPPSAPAVPALPLLVGGTGLYIRSVTKGLIIPRVAPQPELRSQLKSLGQKYCYALLQQVDPQSAERIHPHDEVRTLRSLEVFYTTGYPMSAQQGENPPTYPILHIGLDCAESENLHQRIAHRATQMVAAGFVEEVEFLGCKYGMDLPLLDTLGYAEFKQHLAGQLSLESALEQTILHTRQFAKRQRTWFRAVPEIQWFDADAPDLETQVWQRVHQFAQSVAGPFMDG